MSISTKAQFLVIKRNFSLNDDQLESVSSAAFCVLRLMLRHFNIRSFTSFYTGVDPGFFLGGGASLRNDVTDGEVKRI